MNAPLIKAFKLVYSDNSMSFITHHGLTEPIQTERGVRQGCPLSPTLFAMGINHILQDLTKREEGVSVHGIKLNNMSFADDLALLANSGSDLQKLLDLTADSLRKVGLRLNASKCEYIAHTERLHKAPKLELEFEGQKHTIARHLGASRYLGIWISSDLDRETGINKVWERCQVRLEILSNKATYTEDVIHAINTKILPSILYSRPLMTPTKQQMEALEHIISVVARKRMPRNILKSLLYLNRDTEPGWGLNKLGDRLETDRGAKLLQILNACEQLTALGFNPGSPSSSSKGSGGSTNRKVSRLSGLWYLPQHAHNGK